MALGVRSRSSRSLLHLLCPGLLALGLLMPLGARAQPTAEQARALELQLRAWLVGLIGPNMPVSERPFQVTAEDDHYRIESNITGPVADTGLSIESSPLAVNGKPLDGARWELEPIDRPASIRVIRDLPDAKGFRSVSVKIGGEAGHWLLDPSFATASTFETTIRDYVARREWANGSQTSRIERLISQSTWEPTEGGRLNIVTSVTAEHPTSEGALPDGGRLILTAERETTTGRLMELAPERIGEAIRAAAELAPLVRAEIQIYEKAAPTDCTGEGCSQAATSQHGTPTQRQALHALIQAVRGLMTGMNGHATFDKVHIIAGPHEASLDRAAFGTDAIVLDGMLHARLSLAVDGLDSPEIPAGVFRQYLPRHVALTPRVSGIPSTAGIDLLLRAIDSPDDNNSEQLQAEAKGLMRQGPLTFGLDDVTLDLGPARLTASGEVQVPAPEPEEISGHADISATGLDALVKQAHTQPDLRRALPVLIMLKGLGEQDGEATVWHVTYRDRQWLVNGNDLTQMVPGK